MELTTDETVKILLEKGIFQKAEDLNKEELFQYRKELKDIIASIPDDEPEVIANFSEDLEYVETLISKLR